MAVFLCNAFNDPNDPWYYVIGALFLVLIFGALAVYIVFSNKMKKKNGDSDSSEQPHDGPTEGKEPISETDGNNVEVKNDETDEKSETQDTTEQ